jgi:glycogen debranching enzyme
VTTTPSRPDPQPYLHELVTTVRAPASALSCLDGQLRARGAQGLLVADVRHLSEFVVLVAGSEPEALGHQRISASRVRFVGAVRELGDPIADPTVRLERDRVVEPDRLRETITLVNDSREPIRATVSARFGCDLARMATIKSGRPTTAVAPRHDNGSFALWQLGSATTTVRSAPYPDHRRLADDHAVLEWAVEVAARDRVEIVVDVMAGSDTTDEVFVAPDPLDHQLRVTSREPALDRLAATGLSDLAALTMADAAAPGDRFSGAGSPWYLTLFGRDSLWTARFALPLGTDLALGTLRTLARRQGTRHDQRTAEQPGKMPHEIRRVPSGLADAKTLPATYYGTIDATPLWISLLHDAWRWGLPSSEVAALLDPLERALEWTMVHADADGDGFLEYHDESGTGLANQGWKDSGDSIQDSAGALAAPPIALSEAQGYAHRAALDAATLLDAFDRPGGPAAREYAAELSTRFRDSFWTADADGPFPALALDGAKRPVDSLASNMGHLLDSDLLSLKETALVAGRLSDLDSGYGVRTLSANHPMFNPLGYHTGTVWPHDTAIAISGLAGTGHLTEAAALSSGLLRAGARFDYRLPELYGGWSAEQGPLLDYAAACRPQAWAAACPLVLLRVALGLTADVPAGRLEVRPAKEFAAWFPLRVSGLRVAGRPLAVYVDADGSPTVQTDAPLRVE